MKTVEQDKVPAFDDIIAFANWWNFNGGFILPPTPLEIYNIGVATTVVIFRHGRFQVEQYVLCNNNGAQEHCHPGIDSVINTGGELFGQRTTEGHVVKGGKPHGKGFEDAQKQKEGSFFYTLQHWTNPKQKMSSILCSWDGAPPLTEAHAELIEEQHANDSHIRI
jgi:hypothetical protein